MQQVRDFLDECDALDAVLGNLNNSDFKTPTQFKNWTVNDVLVHLHFWNLSADLGVFKPDALRAQLEAIKVAMTVGSLRDMENTQIPERGQKLREIWRANYQQMAQRWSSVDPKLRVEWAGPTMSARSSMTARQMETWAHGHEIFDFMGKQRIETDRIRNIVILGVNTFGWSHTVNGFPVPETVPLITLRAPSGDRWVFGEDTINTVQGSAVGFAQVVTQTRAFGDTDLIAAGPIAKRWMETAQCFAGPRENPPSAGSRAIT
jgi:uncharacterized protein (TIGR03084 family)